MSPLQRLKSLPGKLSLHELIKFGTTLRPGPKPCLLLTWDVCGLHAAVSDGNGNNARLLGEAFSGEGRLPAALGAVWQQLAEQGVNKPKHAIFAARHVLPIVADLPVTPGKQRPRTQMRELVQADLEPALAEFGNLWSMGALMQARGYLDGNERQRISQEEATRRQGRQNQLRFGEIALEIGLIERSELDECLDQQAALQNLEASLVAAWLGRMEEREPVWLVCGIGERVYREWRDTLTEAGFRLDAVVPLSWLASQDQPATSGESRHDGVLPKITLELHQEEVVAICRRHGRVVGARSEGRVERKLGSDWLTRLIADWASEPRMELEIRALHADDDNAISQLAEDLALTTGHTCRGLLSSECRPVLWNNLLREGSGKTPNLPRLLENELRGSLWNNHDVRRGAAIAAVLLGIVGIETYQQFRLHQLEIRMAERKTNEEARSRSTQQLAQVNLKLQELGRSLDETRRQLEPLLNERSRMNSVLSMQADLPELLYTLAQSVGTDAVLDEVNNDVTSASGASVHVRAWSPSYTGAQAFVSRVAETLRQRAWGVAQTEFVERVGRTGRPGHEVNFWLLPEEGELEPTEAEPPGQAGIPAMPAGTTP